MKVGTDGLLLGAWVDLSNIRNAMDVGAGSGLISLMLAQRKSDLNVLGIEIDQDAAQQALENVKVSSFSNRIEVVNDSFLNLQCEKGDYLVVSNPPFFKVGQPSRDDSRRAARHGDQLSLVELLEKTVSLIGSNGRFALIWPMDRAEELFEESTKVGLFPLRITFVRTEHLKHPSRVLAEFAFKRESLIETTITVQSNGVYTAEYKELLKDFYLDF